ncbi:zinc finger CCCH domain-containing protein 30 [Canna indica]|uniref:Zinc finger CCCH domain-containing protein 30 n=1 Tax=Canna indica TaxID=4628 RepID=A0AAQ3JS57_9LILI|nr:zinc finger CCCH domain-containing protein 30 [Canna indica]
MAGLKQSKRVSWARELNQVRLFLAEDAPALSRLGTQDNLQAKGSWLLHASSIGNDDSSLPPGFEAPHPAYQLKSEISKIPLVKWKCPPNMFLNPKWVVVAGEESEEVDVQNKRQMRVLEAIYPRLSSIPPNPSVLPEVQDSFYDDFQTPVIPITAIEEEDSLDASAPSTSSSTQFHQTNAHNLQGMSARHDLQNFKLDTEQSQGHPVQVAPSVPHSDTAAGRTSATAEPDVLAAASAAFTAIMKSNEEGSMIDRDLLINILSNPRLVEKLVTEYGAPKQVQEPSPTSVSVPPLHAPIPVQPRALAPPVPPPLPPINTGAPPLPAFQTPQMYPLASSVRPQVVNPHALPSIPIPPKPLASGQAVVKDANYLKSLVQQHGGEKQEASDMNMHAPNYQNNVVAGNAVDLVNYGPKQHNREARPKIPKPCAFFNTPKGCRHGANCSYQHDPSLQQRIEQPRGSKRIKLDRGIANRN